MAGDVARHDAGNTGYACTDSACLVGRMMGCHWCSHVHTHMSHMHMVATGTSAM
jgi:hypothetical protein